MVVDWDTLEKRTVIPGFVGRVCHSDTMTFVLWDIARGAILPEHNHIHEQIAHVLEGEFEMMVGGKSALLRAGMVGMVPANARHSGRAVTDCRILDVFYPIREDYLNGLTGGTITGGVS